MAILVDPPQEWIVGKRHWKYGASSHMVSDLNLDELHAFAKALGLRRDWFQGNHYDLTVSRYERALKAGAIQVASRDLVRRMLRPKAPGREE